MSPQGRGAGDDILIQSREEKKSLSFFTFLYFKILPLKHRSIAIVRFVKDPTGFLSGTVDESRKQVTSLVGYLRPSDSPEVSLCFGNIELYTEKALQTGILPYPTPLLALQKLSGAVLPTPLNAVTESSQV